MKTLLLLCGRPFSGKTTLAERLARACGAPVLSLDAVNLERGLRSGDGLPAEEWAATLEEGKRRARALLRDHARVVVDDTLCFRWIRDAFRALAAEAGAEAVLVYLDPPSEVLKERMRATDRIAPDVLEEHLRSFEDPGEDEHPVRLRTPAQIEAWLFSA